MYVSAVARPVRRHQGCAGERRRPPRRLLALLSRQGREHEQRRDNHHQALARTHKLSDGSIYFFLAHSDLDSGHGIVGQFRYSGPTDQEHVLETSPRRVASKEELLRVDDPHPSDIVFLRDVNDLDAGYLFVAKEFRKRRVSVYRWAPEQEFALQGQVFQGFPAVLPGDPEVNGGRNYLFIDRVDHTYFLGVASSHWARGQLLSAREAAHLPLLGCQAAPTEGVSAVKAGRFPVESRPCLSR